jgi:hypothetical protein
MPAQIEPRSGLFWGWDLGESGWKPGMDANLLKLGRFGFHLSVKDRDLVAPPGSPAAGDTYIVAASATGDWAGMDGQVAIWDGAAWQYGTPRKGWTAYLEDEDVRVTYKGTGWSVETPSYTDEQIRDVIGAALVAGSGISITVNDAGDTITIENIGGGGGSYTDEQARDAVGSALVAGTGISIVVDDGADTITVSSDLDKASVYRNAAGNSHTSGWAKVELDTVSFDTNSIWNAAGTRFIPKKAGYYQVTVRVRRATSSTMVVGVGKNGSLYKVLGPDAGSMFGSGGSGLVYCNGTTDYLEPFLYSTSAIAYSPYAVDTWMDVIGPF